MNVITCRRYFFFSGHRFGIAVLAYNNVRFQNVESQLVHAQAKPHLFSQWSHSKGSSTATAADNFKVKATHLGIGWRTTRSEAKFE